MNRPLIPAAFAFLIGVWGGSPALLAIPVLLLLGRTGLIGAAFLSSGALSAPEPASETPPSELAVFEASVEARQTTNTGTHLQLRLVGAGPPGGALRPLSGPAWASASGDCAPGDRVRILGRARQQRPMGFTGEGAVPVRTWIAARRCTVLSRDRPLLGFIASVRDRLRRTIAAAEPRRPEIITALAVGDRGKVARPVRDSFADSGLSHLLAVSGLHLSIVAASCTLWLARLFGLFFAARRSSTRMAAPFAAGLVVIYTTLVGAPPSAVRAAAMVLLLLLADLLERRRDVWTALAGAGMLMVALEPGRLTEPAFQLSFSAVAALLLAPMPRQPRRLALLVEPAWMSLVATAGTAPVLVWHFGRVSLIGLLTNVVATPLATLAIVPLSLGGALLGCLSPTLGRPLLQAAGLGADLLVMIAEAAATHPYASISVTPLEALLSSAVVLLILFGRRRSAGVVGVVLLGVILLLRFPAERRALRLTVLPVGQGSAAIVETPSGANILIDAGPPGSGRRVLRPFMRARRIRRLDLVILTHPHRDHTGGFEEVRRYLPIDRVMHNGDLRGAPAELHGLDVTTVTTTVVRFGATRLAVLQAEAQAPNVNDGSVVTMIGYGDRRLLLVGDAERAAESALVDRDVQADLLLVGHHGSNSSSSDDFLAEVSPSHAVISVGRDNRFGHPSAKVLARLRQRNIRVHRTDLHGAVTVITDGRRLEVSRFRPSPREGAFAPR